MENFGRAKANTVRTLAHENKLPQCQRCEKIGHVKQDCRTSRYTNQFPLPRAEKPIGVNAMEKYYVNCKKTGHDKNASQNPMDQRENK
ncbi:hypothetical protein P5V15_004415 [Pogonomyrmex californicus]